MTWQDLLDTLNRIPEDERDNPARFCDENYFDDDDEDEKTTDEGKEELADQYSYEIDNMSQFKGVTGQRVYILTP
jgi:hypothetical protein